MSSFESRASGFKSPPHFSGSELCNECFACVGLPLELFCLSQNAELSEMGLILLFYADVI